MKKGFLYLLLSLLFTSTGCQQAKKDIVNEYNVIPLPNQLVPKDGRFELNNNVIVNALSCSPEVQVIADNFIQQINTTSGIKLKKAEKEHEGAPVISFVTVPGMEKEAYKLSVSPSLITISATEPNGFFYGIQTLYKLLPAEVYGQTKAKAEWSVPCVEVEDAPRLQYRGLMLDPCRHFVSTDYIYKFIDMLAINKMNTMHWHLTDDQGWRIEIKKYPKLTEIGSKRKETLIGYYYENYPFVFDGKEHGGYYTQEEIKDIVAYAASKYITVIPEIEMPGHAIAAVSSYPELSCNPEAKHEVTGLWGVFDDVFCPREETFTFLEGVMDEVIELFPSSYIHIGGDECPKTEWKNNAFCQNLIKQLGLKDDTTPNKVDGKKHTKEEKLQSYFIGRMEKYLNGKGRNIIGWDEILEGGLAPNATVMSWRGAEGGIIAAKAGHNAIMTASPYMYLDTYQEPADVAPNTIGGYMTLKAVYSFNPVADDADEMLKKHIIGLQANLWSEYMGNIERRDYQAFPRVMAVAESAWTQNKNKDFKNFCERMAEEFRRLDILDIKACRNFFDVNFNTKTDNGVLKVYMETFYPNGSIHYTTDGSLPTTESPVYTEAFPLEGNINLQAAVFDGKDMVGKVTSKALYGNLIAGKSYTVTPENNGWKGDILGENDMVGADTITLGLTNGKRGYPQSYTPWVGFNADKEVVFTAKLDAPTKVSKVVFGTLHNPAYSILPASAAVVEVSADGKNFKEVANQSFKYDIAPRGRQMFTNNVEFPATEAEYVRVHIKNGGMIKNGVDCIDYPNKPAEFPSNIFLDEIEVY